MITDGVFSMDGDIGPVGALAALAEKYGAIMMVDDAHASGVAGAERARIGGSFGAHGKVDVQVGTLSKAIGALGGYVCGSRDLIDYLYHRARPFLFFPLRIRRAWRQLALRLSTFWRTSRSGLSGCGRIRAIFSASCAGGVQCGRD